MCKLLLSRPNLNLSVFEFCTGPCALHAIKVHTHSLVLNEKDVRTEIYQCESGRIDPCSRFSIACAPREAWLRPVLSLADSHQP
jgi:hypothetical protein